MRGFPEEVRRELFYRSNLNFENNKRPIDLLIFMEQAERIVSSEQKFQSFFKRPEERGKFDNLIKQLKAKPDVSESRILQAPIAPPLITAESELKNISFSMDNLTNQLNAIMLALSNFNASNNNNVMPQRQNIIRFPVKGNSNTFTVKTIFPSVSRYPDGINPGGFGIARRFNNENMTSRNKCWWDHENNHILFRYYDMANWIQTGRVH